MILPAKFYIRILACLGLGLALLNGCATRSATAVKVVLPLDRPENVYLAMAKAPAVLRRVAVLPVSGDADTPDFNAGCAALRPVVYDALCRTKKFETVSVNPARLRALSGRESWSAEDVLPANFFGALREAYGCDAVLFSELTVFQPYAPVKVGWRFKLVDVSRREILWAADEIFDGGKTEHSRWEKKAEEMGLSFLWPAQENWEDSHSPGQVGRYSAGKLLATLPDR